MIGVAHYWALDARMPVNSVEIGLISHKIRNVEPISVDTTCDIDVNVTSN